MEFRWEPGFAIKTRVEADAFVVCANRQGLLSLANHLRDLADCEPSGHFHLDQWNSLEDGSVELIVERDDSL